MVKLKKLKKRKKRTRWSRQEIDSAILSCAAAYLDGIQCEVLLHLVADVAGHSTSMRSYIDKLTTTHKTHSKYTRAVLVKHYLFEVYGRICYRKMMLLVR